MPGTGTPDPSGPGELRPNGGLFERGAILGTVPILDATRTESCHPFASNVHPVRDVAAAVAGSVSGVVKKVLGKGDAS